MIEAHVKLLNELKQESVPHVAGSAPGPSLRAMRETEMNITAEMVRELRERTGEGLMSCKAALVAHAGDMEGAYEHLRCEGQAVLRKGPNARQPCGCPVRQGEMK